MHQKIDKKTKFFFYSLLIIILTSINNYNFINQNLFKIKYIDVNGFSIDKNLLIKNQINKIYEKNIFFINKENFSKMIYRDDTKYLHIKKNFPNKLIINFTPAKPLCIVDIKSNKIILGDNGRVLSSLNNENILPIITGSIDLKNIYYVVTLLNESNLDYSLIKKIIFFKSNRFDIELSNGMKVKFPIKYDQDTINYSANLLKKKEFKNSKIIDLRINNKIIKYE